MNANKVVTKNLVSPLYKIHLYTSKGLQVCTDMPSKHTIVIRRPFDL